MSDPFDLPPEDIEYLDANFPTQWRKLNEGNGKFGLMIKEFSIPDGFTSEISDLMILIPAGYPMSPLDMFYFDPPLSKGDGSGIGALAMEQHFDRNWQRWSRHYQWNSEEDDLTRHIRYVRQELEKESVGSG